MEKPSLLYLVQKDWTCFREGRCFLVEGLQSHVPLRPKDERLASRCSGRRHRKELEFPWRELSRLAGLRRSIAGGAGGDETLGWV